MVHLCVAGAHQASILTCMASQAASAARRVPSILTRMQQSAEHAQWEVPQIIQMELTSVHPVYLAGWQVSLRWPRVNFVLQESTSQLKEALHVQAAAQVDLLP